MCVYICTHKIKQGYKNPFGKKKDFGAMEAAKGIAHESMQGGTGSDAGKLKCIHADHKIQNKK